MSAAGRVFVTGGSGFVGEALVRRLVADGRQVVALTRSEEAASALAALGAEPARGDILAPDGLEAAMAGARCVYHAAGMNAFCLRDPSPLLRTNVTGTSNVLEAAARAGVRRVVYTSSAAVLGEPAGTIGGERSSHRGWFLSAYERSKHEAERVALEAARRLGLELVCVNPASVQGPGRTRGTGKLFLDYVNGRLRVLVDTHLSLVDIADCTEGHVLAEQRGVAGERYVLSGATLTTRAAVALVSQVSGARYEVRALPPRAALAGAAGAELLARLRGRRPRFCRELVRTMLHGHRYDGSRATRELGLVYTPIEETIARTLRWYAENGYLERPLTAPST